MEWKDVTTYSQRETGADRTPRTWAATARGFRIIVTRHIGCGPDAWLLRCPLLERELIASDISEAKLEAIGHVYRRLSVILEALK